MAQHDYVIANGTGAAVRSDLNSALAAIVSQNSGATAPSTTYAYMPWADTTTGLFKIRNAANNGWITLYQLDGEWSTIALENGTAGAPSIYFKDSGTDTGIYSPGTDQVAISTGGTGRLFVDASGNVKVGSTDNSNAATQYITVGSVGVTDGGLQLWARTTGSSYVQFGDTTTSADQYRGYMAYLHSSDALTFGTASVERIRVDSSGRVGIGNAGPQSLLHLGSSSGDIPIPTGNFATIRAGTYASASTAGIQLSGGYGDNGTNGAFNIKAIASGSGGFVGTNALAITTTTAFGGVETERIRIDSSGRLLVGTSTSTNNVRLGEKLAVVTTGGSDYGGASLTTYAGSTAALSPLLEFQRSRGTTDGSMSAVGNGDSLGQIIFRGATGSAFESAANITAEVDGAVSGAGDIPGRLVFSTTADGASSPTERFRIDSTGSWTANAARSAEGSSSTDAAFLFRGASGTSQVCIMRFDAGNFNAAACAMSIGRNSVNSRSINAGGSINASGADYAEYMIKAGTFDIAKGDVCGVNASGMLTNVFADAVTFVVKSTNPSYVGGDTWGTEDVLGETPSESEPEALAQWQAALEAERQKVDRIAFAGQVPVNVTGATPGQYIIPVTTEDGGITGIAKDEADLTLAEYMRAVGKVIAIEDDGRARIIVKVA